VNVEAEQYRDGSKNAELYAPLLDELLARVRSYSPDADAELITRAFWYAASYHDLDTPPRCTGEPYFTHPIAAARILTDVQMDSVSITAALCHDLIEDTRVTREQLEADFGVEIATMVDGVTKLRLADFETQELTPDAGRKRGVELRRNAENLRRIFLAVAKDLRVMMIKLADRLHNMSTLYALPPDRQKKVAEETQQIYAPLAHRLGVWTFKWQLEDLAFKYLEPDKFEEIVEKVDRTRADREDELQEAIGMLRARLEAQNLEADIHGRPKHLWSIYQKMLKEQVDFADIYDLTAIRVIVDTVPECYVALGIVHDMWIPIAGRFDDYIARAKPNMYQSLHTKVIGPRGMPIEIQIRTVEMHQTAEFGIAAHWQYKEGGSGGNGFDRKLSWLRQQLFDWQADNKNANDFLRAVVNDLFADQVFVFTPQGRVIDLPVNSTPIDFAYRVHSDLGHHCVAAKENGRIIPLSHPLANGAIVEIISRSNAAPSRDWLTFVKTSHARNKIKSYFRRLNFAESVTKGRELIEKEIERRGLDRALLKGDALATLAPTLNKQSEDDLLASVGFGHIGAATVVHKLAPPETPRTILTGTGRQAQEGKVALESDEQIKVTRATCCSPIPGDEVTGYISRGRGLTLHHDSCPNLAAYRESEPERLMKVDWAGDAASRYQTELRIETLDRVGLLTEVASIVSEMKINISDLKAKVQDTNKMALIELKVEVKDLTELNQLLVAISRLSDVMLVHRLGGRKTRRRGKPK